MFRGGPAFAGEAVRVGAKLASRPAMRITEQPMPNPKTEQSPESYRDRPSDDGKHGDGSEQPNAGFPADPEVQDLEPGDKPPR
jgi:hypothetical protein